MSIKYSLHAYDQPELGKIGEYGWLNRKWSSHYFCRELAVNELPRILYGQSIRTQPTVLRLVGENMRPRTMDEQKGMARFASIMFPEHFTFVDSYSIWIESERKDENSYSYPMKEVFSVAWFFIKYLTIQMQNRVDIDRICKAFIKRKHQCFRGLPDQQLGTAFYTWAYIQYKDDLICYSDKLSKGNGPGTAMRGLANEDEESIVAKSDASNFYSFLLDEWTSQYKSDIAKTMDYHCRNYARVYYMPLLMQDIYKRIYDGDGYFDGIEYGDNEW